MTPGEPMTSRSSKWAALAWLPLIMTARTPAESQNVVEVMSTTRAAGRWATASSRASWIAVLLDMSISPGIVTTASCPCHCMGKRPECTICHPPERDWGTGPTRPVSPVLYRNDSRR
jgi:hypothetical protein